MASRQKVLVVEDHDQLNEMMCRALDKAGFTAHGLYSAEELSEYSELHTVDVFLIDWNLPGEDGASLTKRLRMGFPNAAFILLTARSGATNQIHGYLSGADLYLSKPVKTDELTQAILALGIRTRLASPTYQESSDEEMVLKRSSLTLEVGANKASITFLEVKILSSFVASNESLLEVWQLSEIMMANGLSGSSRSIEVQISRLRKKLSELTNHPNPLPFVRGKGYQLVFKLTVL